MDTPTTIQQVIAKLVYVQTDTVKTMWLDYARNAQLDLSTIKQLANAKLLFALEDITIAIPRNARNVQLTLSLIQVVKAAVAVSMILTTVRHWEAVFDAWMVAILTVCLLNA